MFLDDLVGNDSVLPAVSGVDQPCLGFSALILAQLFRGDDDVSLILATKLFRQVILLQIPQPLD